MVEFDDTLKTALVVYAIACYGLYILKHEKMFDEQGNFRNFGLQKGETISPFWLVTTVIGLSTYYALVVRHATS